MEVIRCENCNRKLAEADYTRLAIKCPRCGAINHVTAASRLPERLRASYRKERIMATTRKAPGKNGFSYKEQFGVIVICENATEQEAVFDKLKALGFAKLKVVTV